MTNHDDACPSCGRPIRRCAECNKKFAPLRDDAITCSDLCRVHRSRRVIRARKKAEATA